MQKELQTLIEIESKSGTGSNGIKQTLIKDNFSPILEYFLKISLDPFIKTNISKISVLKESIAPETSFESVQSILSKLIGSKAANNELRAELHNVLNGENLSYQERQMLGKIASKSLNIGIGAKLVNKAIGKDLIPDPSVMLAETDEAEVEKWLEKFGFAYVEEKYDGVRVIAFKKNGIITFFTRNFNQLLGMTKIEEEVSKLLENHDNIFIDGELTDLDRKSVSGKVTKIIRGGATDGIDESFLYHLFDTNSSTVYDEIPSNKTYTERREDLENLMKDYQGNTLRIATRWKATSGEEIMGIYKDLVKQGGEGIIIKKPDHIYELKRTKNWNKIKEIQDCDLVIVGTYPGEGKRLNLIGGFKCESSCGQLKVRVGSGFTDEFLNLVSQNPESYIGRIAKVIYNVRIVDKHGDHSLFLPRLDEVREDKTEADHIDKIK